MAIGRAGSRSWLRLGSQASALAAGASLGFLVAAQPRTAAADGLLPTTVTIPSVPVTLPTLSLPVTTNTAATTTTTAPATTSSSTTLEPTSPPGTTAGAAGVTGTTEAVAATPTKITLVGALHLAGVSTSIPVKSVVAPNHLLLVVTLAPRIVTVTGRLTANIRVRDARGNLVRGASVRLQSVPGGVLDPVAMKRSATDGRTTFVLHATQSASGNEPPRVAARNSGRPDPAEDRFCLQHSRHPDRASGPLGRTASSMVATRTRDLSRCAQVSACARPLAGKGRQ